MTKGRRRLLWFGGTLLVVLAILATQLPTLGAAALLHPFHKPLMNEAPDQCRVVTIDSDGIQLQGWRGDAVGTRRGP